MHKLINMLKDAQWGELILATIAYGFIAFVVTNLIMFSIWIWGG